MLCIFNWNEVKWMTALKSMNPLQLPPAEALVQEHKMDGIFWRYFSRSMNYLHYLQNSLLPPIVFVFVDTVVKQRAG